MEKNSELISTQKSNVVVEATRHYCGVKVKKVKYLGTEDTYNMEVENHHNFAVNGGFIVHNCLDALRYAVFGRQQEELSKPQFFKL
ncbi:hypothetical protein [Fructilactobacillus ixorae]|uniref:hypothetical protein n=1 Tax=Fructilactobacillus ixorae TaxID=1750535 RepID=UPI00338EF0A0